VSRMTRHFHPESTVRVNACLTTYLLVPVPNVALIVRCATAACSSLWKPVQVRVRRLVNPSRPDNQAPHRSGQKIRMRDMMTGVP
jgi:hypothetical protein